MQRQLGQLKVTNDNSSIVSARQKVNNEFVVIHLFLLPELPKTTNLK